MAVPSERGEQPSRTGTQNDGKRLPQLWNSAWERLRYGHSEAQITLGIIRIEALKVKNIVQVLPVSEKVNTFASAKTKSMRP